MSDSNDSGRMTQDPTLQESGIFNRVIDYILDKINVRSPQENHDPIVEPQENLDVLHAKEAPLYGDSSSKGSDAADDLIMMGKSGLDDFHFHDQGLIAHDTTAQAQNPQGPVNQNGVSLQDHIAVLSEDALSQVRTSNDDVIHPALATESDVGRMYSFETINAYPAQGAAAYALNDAGHNVLLDASDILDMGNHLIITGHEQDSVAFQDSGWSMLSIEDLPSLGLDPIDGYNTYVHESGAIVQIEHVIQTDFNPDGVI